MSSLNRPGGVDVAGWMRACARGNSPELAISPVEWAQRHFVLPDGERRGQLWDLTIAPYASGILELLAVESPHTEIVVMKSAQTGFTTLGLVWLGYLIDCAPDTMLMVRATLMESRDFNRTKLDPAIRESPRLRRKVREQSSRSAFSSTMLFKRFSGGSLIVIGANSPSDLRGKTIRFAFCDEVDAWPTEIKGEGDPMGKVEARQISFTRAQTYKRFIISTPTVRGSSRIERRYLAGDRRKWHMPCPHCSKLITLDPDRSEHEAEPPYKARYIAQCCGAEIASWQQRDMVQNGQWIATKPGPGRGPSFHVNSLISLVTSWDAYADAKLKSGRDQRFVNGWDGEPFDFDTAEVPAEDIVAGSEDYQRGVVPPWCGVTVMSVDLNGEWLKWALYGFGPSRLGLGFDQTLIDTGQVSGRPDDDTLWERFSLVMARGWKYASGAERRADVVGIDTGHGTYSVYRFIESNRRNAPLRALDGRANSATDPKKIPLGTPSWVPCKTPHGRILFRLPLYPVNGFDSKEWLSTALKRMAAGEVATRDIRLSREIVDLAYADQLTSELLVKRETSAGFTDRRWEKRRGIRNEALDLAVYARALALGARPNGLGVDRISASQWETLLSERHGAAPAPRPAPPEEPPPTPPAAPAAVPSRPKWLGDTRKSFWS